MRISIPLLATAALLLTLTSCLNTERETATATKGPHTEFTPPRGRGERVNGATVLHTVRVAHVFSSLSAPDTFVLQLRGPRVLSSRAYFSVLNSRGDTLHREVLPASVLLTDPTLRSNESASVRDREINILRGMNTFFSDTHFERSAAPVGSDAPAVSFDYLGSTASQRLVYSRQTGRAVIVKEE
ncbi:hypothetical protein [Hymenobacter psoromatis]|uniref:hypothetical protein n=1 Tax=Hymenobacter psoromatis TaxID=1484116 RepID=UPI001CBEA032|nr:hypothetical protein [Hymenobacter psoromatis]